MNTLLNNLNSLLAISELSDAQRQIIKNVMRTPPKYQQWFLDQFTRNR